MRASIISTIVPALVPALVLGVTALAACAVTPAATGTAGPEAQWRCDRGAAFSFRMTADGNGEVFAGGQTYNLPAMQAADGNRYSNGAVEYWEKGDSAILNGAAGGPYENCHR
jgi:membrane-bound inhibitor of C-type lysozyme